MPKIKIKKLKQSTEMLKIQLKTKENEILKLRLITLEREMGNYRKELDEIHESISYKVGRKIAETKIGGLLKKSLRNKLK